MRLFMNQKIRYLYHDHVSYTFTSLFKSHLLQTFSQFCEQMALSKNKLIKRRQTNLAQQLQHILTIDTVWRHTDE